MGWSMPEQYWFDGPLKEWINAVILTSTFLDGLAGKFCRHTFTVPYGVRRLNIAAWHECFFGERRNTRN